MSVGSSRAQSWRTECCIGIVRLRYLFICAVACAPVSLLAQQTFTARVVRIVDGDTIEVLHDRVPERITLYGIDCPEKKQAFGTRAKQYTGELTFGRAVEVRVREIDRYGRTVGEV